MQKGIIIKNISNLYTVLDKKEEYVCQIRGKLKHQKILPLVGDEVIYDPNKLLIVDILPRQNYLLRPSVANVDYSLIVTSLKEPDFSSYLLDKQISYSLLNNIKPIICFTKLDKVNNNELKIINKYKKYYENLNIKTFDNQNINKLIKFLKDKIVVLTGQSGAGKSTLLNKIEPNLNLKTAEISIALNRGKHTTRHCELYHIQNIWFCDTPGFSSLDLNTYTKEEIKNSFPEFKTYTCRYKDCFHDKEQDCLVKLAVNENKILPSRYESYLKLIKDVK